MKPSLMNCIYIHKTSSAYSSSNSLRFNPILQKFWEMICGIIFFNMVCEMFLIFCRILLIDFFVKWSDRKLNILRLIYFLKNYAHRFENLICTNKLEGFFFKIFFQWFGAFFMTAKPFIWASIFAQKVNFVIFLNVFI